MPLEADVPQIASLHYVKQLCPQSVRALLQSWPQFYDEHVVSGIGTVKDTLMQLDDSYRESLQALRQQRFHKGVSLTCYEVIGVNRLFEQHSTAQLQQFTEKARGITRNALCVLCA